MKTELTIRDLSNPKDIMAFSKTLKDYVMQNQLTTSIQGKNYVNVDGWKFAGLNFGIVPIVEEPEEKTGEFTRLYLLEEYKTSQKGQYWAASETTFFPEVAAEWQKKDSQKFRTKILRHYNYKCKCNVVRVADGKIIGSGSAVCTNAELKKVTFDEYAVSSMAQTRAIGKALRNLIGFVMSSAGFETTPAEEMEGVNENRVQEIKDLVEGCKTLAELELMWKSNKNLHKNANFKTLIQTQKTKLEQDKSTEP